MAAGLLLTGLGGFGFFYLGRTRSAEADLKQKAAALSEEVASLRKDNKDLRERVEKFGLADSQSGSSVAVATASPAPGPKTESAAPASPEANPQVTRRAAPIPAKVTAPPLKSAETAMSWSEAPTLEQMVEWASTTAPKKAPALSGKQQEEMAKVLRKHAGKSIAIHSVAGDKSGLEFAETLRHAFVDAGWRVDHVNAVAFAKPPVGLCLSTETFPSPEEGMAAYQALTAAGFEVSQQLDSKLGGQKAVLLVGQSVK